MGQKKFYLSQSLSSFPQSGQGFPIHPGAGLKGYLGLKGHPLGEGPGLQAKGKPRLLGPFIPDGTDRRWSRGGRAGAKL